MLKPGDPAPDFAAPDQTGTTRTLGDFAGRRLVLYFYPKDMTPGCTVQACDFRDNLPRFAAAGVAVVGVSPDSVKRHVKFAQKESLPFTLLADTDTAMAQAYGVWDRKTLFGRKYMGVVRTTFLIDETGRIEKIWSNVRVPGHIEEVADAVAG